MLIESSRHLDTLNTRTVALKQRPQLAALLDADPSYACAVEQVAVIVTELQSRATPATGLLLEALSLG